MKCRALFVIVFVLAVGTMRAQQEPNPPVDVAPSRQTAPQAGDNQPVAPQLTPETRGDILVARKDYALAIKTYEEILQKDPRNAPLLNKIGICYQQLGDLGRARQYYQRATKADKKYASAINNLGTLDYTEKRYSKAIKSFKKALLLKGEEAGVYSNLGYAYCGIKDYPRAMEAFSKALALDPEIFERKGGVGAIVQQRQADDLGSVYFTVARSYAKAGDAEHAARYLKQARDNGYKKLGAVQKDPDFARVIDDRRVQEVLRFQPPYAPQPGGPAPK
ncbi:MAG: tetratricopeptide repeat protein [Acidobacteriia bacterium]|nr:tetratricopeptide repeat protein [Terriglobia bacterium]